MANRFGAVLSLALLMGCGGGSNSPVAPPAPVPTPAPVSHTGFFAGNMLYNPGTGSPAGTVRGTIAIVHSGSNVQFGTGLHLAVPGAASTVTFLLGSGTLVGDTVRTSTSYQSSGCGLITTNTTARFGGNQMNLTVELTSASCAPSRAVGELSR